MSPSIFSPLIVRPLAWMAFGTLLANGLCLRHVTGQDTKTRSSASPIQLTDVTQETGIGFVHSSGASGLGYIVEAMAGGLALFDYDGDGWIDIYFTNGAPLKGSKESPKPCIMLSIATWGTGSLPM